MDGTVIDRALPQDYRHPQTSIYDTESAMTQTAIIHDYPLTRSGKVIDFVTNPRPLCAQSIQSEILEYDYDAGWVETQYMAPVEFTTPGGFLQGGFVAALLDDVISLPTMMRHRGEQGPATLELSISYLDSVPYGRLFGKAWIVRMGRSIGFLEAELRDPAEKLLAKATTTIKVRPLRKAQV